ncbi:hypothetical protein PMZ80_009624 [Knufia obscura]|uniref:DUF1996 domain-containing protein n=1 Tax=Knufia obscura TaxID=1635080 RepID=A0ABR0RBQ5_9EURO|nr:hypothetical protein PMZ80_009624 [Knufia obscura]
MSVPEVKLKPTMGKMSLTLLAITAFTSPCDAFFRNLMISDTAMARVDPIVNRGEPGMHVHHLTGGGNLDFESTGETLSNSECTNSILTQDKSAYWAPWMYFEHENGTIQNVELALGLTAYYKYEKRGNTGGDVEYSVFPKGLKMLSGHTDKREWKGPWPVPEESLWGKEDTTQEALQEKAMGFNCMNYEPGKNEPTFAYPWLRNKDFLDQNCINGIRAEIIFPSCWDGENLDSDDHMSHTAFPTLIQDGVCPDTHPIYLPILFYETIWQTNAFKGVPGRFVLANGDPTGYGYHADFIAAWDDGVQEQIRDDPQCTGIGTSGEVETCPVFQGKIQSQKDAASCKLTLPSSIVDEKTDGFLEGLPGDVKIKGERHDPGTKPDSSETSETYEPSASVPKTRASAEATATNTTAYYHEPVTSASSILDGVAGPLTGKPGVFATGAAPAQVVSPSATTFATSAAPSQSGSTTTTTYTSGKYVVEMVLVQMVQTVTATEAPAMTETVVVNASDEAAHAKARRSQHARKHVHNHGHF